MATQIGPRTTPRNGKIRRFNREKDIQGGCLLAWDPLDSVPNTRVVQRQSAAGNRRSKVSKRSSERRAARAGKPNGWARLRVAERPYLAAWIPWAIVGLGAWALVWYSLSTLQYVLLYLAIGAVQAWFCDWHWNRSEGSPMPPGAWLLLLVAWPFIYLMVIYLGLTRDSKNV